MKIENIKVSDDFAHHPTAVATTLDLIELSYLRKGIFALESLQVKFKRVVDLVA